VLGQLQSVLTDAVNEVRLAAAEKPKPEHLEPGCKGDAAAMADLPSVVEDGQLQPRIAHPRRSHHRQLSEMRAAGARGSIRPVTSRDGRASTRRNTPPERRPVSYGDAVHRCLAVAVDSEASAHELLWDTGHERWVSGSKWLARFGLKYSQKSRAILKF
jgi:hypothetical protein